MDNELRKKLEGIQALMNRAGTVAEAESAAGAMQRMMVKHNLETADLEGLGQKAHEEYLSKYVVLGAKGTTGLQWRINLAYAVAQMNFCAFIREGVHGGSGWMVGQASNIDAAEQMFKTIVDANERLAPLEWSAFRNTPEGVFMNATAWRNSFKLGFVTGIYRRMQMERQKLSQELETGVVSSLVVVKDGELQQAVSEKLGRVTTHRGSAPTNRSGYERGVEKGLSHELRSRLDA
jgi:hypothetical protein